MERNIKMHFFILSIFATSLQLNSTLSMSSQIESTLAPQARMNLQDAPTLVSTLEASTQNRFNDSEIRYLVSNDVICNNQSTIENTKPQLNFVGGFVISCIFQNPIRWDVDFSPKLVLAAGNLPYEVLSEYKRCPSEEGMKEDSNPKSYFEIILKFNVSHTQLASNTSIKIQCASILNTPATTANWQINKAWWENLNLTQGKLANHISFPVPHSRSKEFCGELELGSDDFRMSYRCLDKNKPRSNDRQANYLKCTDWSNCQQLVAHKFKNTCKFSWNQTYCNHQPRNCNNLINSGIESGIVYCHQKLYDDGTIFYGHFYKLLSPPKFHTFIDGSSTDQVPVKLILSLEQKCKKMKPGKANKETMCEEKLICSAPKFIAVKNFEWIVEYNMSDPISEEKEGKIENKPILYKTKDLEAERRYKEEITFKIPGGFLHVQINVTCKVYLQSGPAVYKSFAGNYTFELSSSDSIIGQNPLLLALITLMGLCLAILLPYFYCKIRRQQKILDFSAEEAERFMKGATVINNSGQNPTTADVLPYDMNLEIPREKLRIIESVLLGKGAFGKVFKGRVENRFVAVKTINRGADGQYFRALLSELKIMSFVGKHANIVELVGANTEKIRKQDVYLIFEFCENGNVLEYIRARRDVFVDQSIIAESSPNSTSLRVYENGLTKQLCTEDLIRWSIEIASGMNFIASRNVYHGDLAARNILLTRDLVAKVGDFGLAKELKDYSLYVQKLGCPLPLKWMAIESLRDLEFSIQSDVWSYGVTLWEMFYLGSTPYPGVEWNFQAWKRLMDGERMDKASNAPQSIHDILLKCWQTLPKDRPNFGEIELMLREELTKIAVAVV